MTGTSIVIQLAVKHECMDREISNKNQLKNQVGFWLKGLASLVLIIAAVFLFRSFLLKSAQPSDFHIAIVEKGDIQNTLTASGFIVPTFEQEINAPVNTEIKNVILSKGTLVKVGELIMELDQEFTKLEYERLDDELKLKRNNVDKLKLQFDKDLKDLDYQDQIKALQIEEMEALIKDEERLLEIGGGTVEQLEKARLNLQVSKLQKKMLENNLEFTQNTNVKEKESLELEYRIQQKKLQELKRKLRETSVKAPIEGVITWINEDIGKTVVQGEPLLRIANLQSYHVEATSSDRHAQKIKVGVPVNVKINKTILTGEISTVLPEVENNTVKFMIELDQANSEVLRPNIRAEVFMITSQKKDILKVKNGAGFIGAKRQNLFVIKDGKAIKTSIEKGLINQDYVEIVSGNLKEGQRVIISDTKNFNHLDQFNLK